MAKRPFPMIPGAYMVPEPKLSAERRAAVLETLRFTDSSEADTAIAEVEEVLGEFMANTRREPDIEEAVPQLESLAEAASQTFGAIGELGTTARLLMFEQDQDLKQASRSLLWISISARRFADEIRPGRGRPALWPERIAIMQLASVWEQRTGSKASWVNRNNDGGPFCRFVQAVSPDFKPGQVRTVLRVRAQKSPQSGRI